jgi:hypothetical protein
MYGEIILKLIFYFREWGIHLIDVTQDRDTRRAVVNTVINKRAY